MFKWKVWNWSLAGVYLEGLIPSFHPNSINLPLIFLANFMIPFPYRLKKKKPFTQKIGLSHCWNAVFCPRFHCFVPFSKKFPHLFSCSCRRSPSAWLRSLCNPDSKKLKPINLRIYIALVLKNESRWKSNGYLSIGLLKKWVQVKNKWLSVDWLTLQLIHINRPNNWVVSTLFPPS